MKSRFTKKRVIIALAAVGVLAIVGVAMVLQSVGTSVFDLGWQTALVTRVPDEHRLRYQAAHTSITGLRGAAAPFAGYTRGNLNVSRGRCHR